MNRALTLVACLCSIAGCAAEDTTEGDAPRLPCGATGSFDEDPLTVTDLVYEYDDAGHRTFEQASIDGEVQYTYRASFDGDQVVHEERTGSWEYTYDVELVDGHRVRAVRDDSFYSDYTQTWQWDGDRVVSWQKRYETLTDANVDATIWYEDDGSFTEELSDGSLRVGVGDYDHWTRYEEYANDGRMFVTKIVSDAHGLILRKWRDEVDSDDPGLVERWTYSRDPDGTLRSFTDDQREYPPSIWRETYAYTCD